MNSKTFFWNICSNISIRKATTQKLDAFTQAASASGQSVYASLLHSQISRWCGFFKLSEFSIKI